MTCTPIASIIMKMKVGEPFTTRQILGIGSRTAVDQTLARLVKAKQISRIARGVYVRPRTSRYAGEVQPVPESIARAVAEGCAIMPHGAEAARRLGLTTQMPLNAVFYTSGQRRTIRQGSLTIQLRHKPLRQMVLAGRPAGLALSALLYLGKRQVSMATLEKIRASIGHEEFEHLRSARQAMPAWLAEISSNQVFA
jgi:hypothetical protein